MNDRSDPTRDAIHDVLQREAQLGKDGAVLTGWAVVTEWMDPDGSRWLSKAHSSGLPTWSAKGLHHEALYGAWPTDDDDA